MKKLVRYLLVFCLMSITATLGFCAYGAYSIMRMGTGLLAGADNYTCREYIYDLSRPETDKRTPLLMAYLVYGSEVTSSTTAPLGNSPALETSARKLFTACQANPTERVLNIVALGVTVPGATPSGTIPSPTTPQNLQ